ncbi:MAG: NAD-binding protein, partial [Desulfobulbaceae bacterium]|nr:NAD-binding protein [Desulfobulbaceae bacterium]
PVFLFENWIKIFSIVLAIAVFKGTVFWVLAMLFVYINIVPIAVGLGLFQVGEFSFVLARVGLETKAIDQDIYSLVLAISVISMAITPFVSTLAPSLYQIRKKLFKKELLQTENLPHHGLKDHVVIAGGGRVGQHIAQVLTQLNLPFVIIELNHQRMVECKGAKFPVVFGDMSQPNVLDVSKVHLARLLLITTPSVVTTQSIVRQVHRIKPELHIIVRADGTEQMRALYESGVYMAVLPEMEAGLEIARQALLHLEIPVSIIQKYTDAVRQHLYAPIYKSNNNHQLLTKFDNIKNMLEISWVTLLADSPLISKSIKEAAIRTKTGVSIVGIIHEKVFYSNPKVDYCFQEGDLVAIVGNQQE